MEEKIFNYDIHGLLKVSSNSPDLIPNYFLTLTKCDKPNIIIRCGERIEIPDREVIRIMPDLCYVKSQKMAISNIRIFGIPTVWALKNLWGKPTEIIFSKNYTMLSKTFLKMPISTVFPIHAYIQHILHVKLLQKNHTFLVGGCFEPRGKHSSIILSSMGGMGKTMMTLEALREIGGKYLGDDMIIINKRGTTYAYPKPIRWRRFNISPISIESHLSPVQVLKSRTWIKERSKIGAVCLLERGAKNDVKPIEPREASAKLLIITRKLLPYYIERTILAHSYMDSSSFLYKFMHEEMKILQSFLAHANCYVLRCKYEDLAWRIKALKSIVDECV
jgi:hypothetical protein